MLPPTDEESASRTADGGSAGRGDSGSSASKENPEKRKEDLKLIQKFIGNDVSE